MVASPGGCLCPERGSDWPHFEGSDEPVLDMVLDAAGQVKLNGGSVGAARTGDACSPSAGMTAWLSAVSGALATLTGGAFPPPVDATYAISGGSTTVKVGG